MVMSGLQLGNINHIFMIRFQMLQSLLLKAIANIIIMIHSAILNGRICRHCEGAAQHLVFRDDGAG